MEFISWRWASLELSPLPEGLPWMILAPAAEWAPRLLHWFLTKRQPFRISRACQYVAQRWRLHPSLSGQHDLAFLRAMHAFWEEVERAGLVRIEGSPLMIYPTPR
jgi:hypothetical protein